MDETGRETWRGLVGSVNFGLIHVRRRFDRMTSPPFMSFREMPATQFAGRDPSLHYMRHTMNQSSECSHRLRPNTVTQLIRAGSQSAIPLSGREQLSGNVCSCWSSPADDHAASCERHFPPCQSSGFQWTDRHVVGHHCRWRHTAEHPAAGNRGLPLNHLNPIGQQDPGREKKGRFSPRFANS